MARGYAQSRSEGGAKDSNYVRSANVPQDDRFKASLAELLKEGYVTPKAKELVDKYGSGEVMDDENVDFDSAKSPNLKRGNFMRSSVRGPEEKEVTKTFKLGKNEKNRTVSVLIKNNKTRKKVEDSKTALKKTNLSTVKNYLKEKNLIKFGTSAPSKLLRDMYESSELCGGIVNENAVNLLHNFDK